MLYNYTFEGNFRPFLLQDIGSPVLLDIEVVTRFNHFLPLSSTDHGHHCDSSWSTLRHPLSDPGPGESQRYQSSSPPLVQVAHDAGVLSGELDDATYAMYYQELMSQRAAHKLL